MNVFGRIKDRIFGPERTFFIKRIKKGEESIVEVRGMLGSGWSVAPYYREIPGRIVTIDLRVDGKDYEINAMEMMGPILRYQESVREGIFPKQIEILERIKEKPIRMRGKEPYDLRTLGKLSYLAER